MSNSHQLLKIIIITLFLFSVHTTSPAQIIITVAGNGTWGFSGDGGPATNAQMAEPGGVALDNNGNLYIADSYNNRIRKVDTAGIITTFAGNGIPGYSGDGGPAIDAELFGPCGIAVDDTGNVIIADFGNSVIRKVNTAGVITTIAGTGVAGYTLGDTTPAIDAEIEYPVGVAVDPSSGLVYFSDGEGIVFVISSTGILGHFDGYGGFHLGVPEGLWVSNGGYMFIAEANNYISYVGVWGGATNVYAGDSTAGYSGDGGPATAAELNMPSDVICGSLYDSWNIYIADASNNRIRKVDTTPTYSSGNIYTYAGTGVAGYSGDGGPATAAKLNGPSFITSPHWGYTYLYISDAGNNVIRLVCPRPQVAAISGGSITLCTGQTATMTDDTTGGYGAVLTLR